MGLIAVAYDNQTKSIRRNHLAPPKSMTFWRYTNQTIIIIIIICRNSPTSTYPTSIWRSRWGDSV